MAVAAAELAEEGHIPEPVHLLLRGPCTHNTPAPITGIPWLHTEHNAREPQWVGWLGSLGGMVSAMEVWEGACVGHYLY